MTNWIRLSELKEIYDWEKPDMSFLKYIRNTIAFRIKFWGEANILGRKGEIYQYPPKTTSFTKADIIEVIQCLENNNNK